jgi:hypothetical protein
MSKFIVDVKVIECDRRELYPMHPQEPMRAFWAGDPTQYPELHISKELIEAQHYRWNSYGKCFDEFIGMSEKVRDALNIPLNVIEDLENENKWQRCENTRRREQLCREREKFRILNQSIWQRIKFLIWGEAIFKEESESGL